MNKADFRASSMKYALFARSDSRKANFGPLYFKNDDGSERIRRTNLTGSDFRYADLREADFSHAVLKGADFSHSLLNKASFENADIDGALFVGTIMEQRR